MRGEQEARRREVLRRLDLAHDRLEAAGSTADQQRAVDRIDVLEAELDGLERALEGTPN